MTNHLNLFLRDETRRDVVEQDQAPRLERPALILPLIFALIFALIGFGGVKEGVGDTIDGVALKTRGAVEQAVVTRMYTSESDSSTNYHITYDYNAPSDPQTHQRSTTLSKRAWRATCQGCKLAIVYRTDKHEVSRLTDEWPIFNGVMLALFTSLFALIGLALGWHTLQESARYWRIRRHGKLRMGTILDVADEERGENKDLHITLQLQLDGDDTTLSYTWSDNKLRGKLPQVGQRIAALHLSDEDFELA
jgi:hypothetical protein